MDTKSSLSHTLYRYTESNQVDFETWGFFQILLDHIPQAVFWKDRKSTYLGCNMAFARHVNLEAPADIIGKSDLDLFDPEDAQLFREYDKDVIESGQAILNYEEIVQKPPVSVIWTRTSKIPIKDKDGKVQIVLGMYEDVTERKLAEIALRKSESKYHAIIEQSVDGFILTDQNGIILELNRALEELLSTERDHAIGSYIWDFQNQFSLPGEKTEETFLWFKELQDALRNDHTTQWIGKPQERKIQTGDGVIKTIQTNIFTIRTNGRWLVGIFIHDISQRKKLQQKLADELLFYKTLLDNIPMPVFHKDEKGTYQGANKAFEEFFGVEADEYIGRETLKVHPTYNDLHAADIDKRLLKNPEKISYRWVTTRYDGEDREVIISKSTFKDGAGEVRGIVGSLYDITEQIKMDLELEKREEKFRSIFHNASDPIFIHTLDGDVIEVNESAADHLGYTREELCEMNLRDFDTPKFAEKVPEKVRELRQSGEAYFLTQHKTKSNRIVDLELHSQIIDFHGETAILSIARDITMRKRLIQREVVYNVMDSMDTGILMVENDSTISHINETLAGMLGYKNSELEKESLNKILYKSTFRELRNTHIHTLIERGSLVLQLKLQAKDGTVHDIPVLVRGVFDSAGKPQSFYGVVQRHLQSRDITQPDLLHRENLTTLCASCKRIQTDKDRWMKIEQFLLQNYDILFSHGLCPECLQSLYMDSEDDDD